MPASATPHLHNLLARFDVARLGEGDLATGANLLAAMACSLASIQRQGRGLVTGDGETIAVGANFIVSGGRSASLISEKVLAGLAIRQNNLLSQLRKKTQSIEEEPKNTNWPMNHSPADFMARVQESIPDMLFRQEAWLNNQGAAKHWSQLVESPAESTFKDLAAHPMVFVTGSSPKALEQQLSRSHLGRPFMHVGVCGAADFSRFEQACPAIMDGRVTKGPTMESIQGTVVVTDPSGALNEAVKADLPNTRWVSRLLWLVDEDAGPEPGKPEEDKALVPLDRLAMRYESAMTTAWGERLNCLTTDPEMVRCEFSKSQARWMAFLKTLETECPGISGTARNVYATLIFGLSRLVNATKTTDDFKWFTDDAEALARFLVQRMVNARAAMLHSAENDLLQQLMEKILIKLADGPLQHRDLVRRFHSLPTPRCLELLNHLRSAGRVIHIDGRWHLPEPALITNSRSN